MGHSPLLGADPAPTEPSGRDTRSLGPSDNSDSGSDLAGIDAGDDTGLPLEEALQDADAGDAPADIAVDRVVRPHRGVGGADEATADDEDADLAFVDAAQAGDLLEDEAFDADDAADAGTSASPSQPDPREPNPAPDGPAPTEPADPAAPPAESGGEERDRPGRVAALLRRR